MKLNKKSVALLLSLALLLTIAVGTTVAIIIAQSQAEENAFAPSYVDCEVAITDTGSGVDCTVTNTSDIAAYVRVKVLINWKSQTTGYIYAMSPEYRVSMGDDWVLGSDGYYYYTKPLAVGAVAATQLTVELLSETPSGYMLSAEVISSAIQTTPDAVLDWSKGVVVIPSSGADLQLNP